MREGVSVHFTVSRPLRRLNGNVRKPGTPFNATPRAYAANREFAGRKLLCAGALLMAVSEKAIVRFFARPPSGFSAR